MRSAWREDADCSPADLVFGTALRLPGQMFEDPTHQKVTTSQFLSEFNDRMSLLRPPAPVHHTQPPSHILKDLASAAAVYVRHDAVRSPLQHSYDGPFCSVKKEPKFFIIDRNRHQDSVTIDRLKVAYLDNSATCQVPTLSTPTTSLKTTSTHVPSYADITSGAQTTTR